MLLDGHDFPSNSNVFKIHYNFADLYTDEQNKNIFSL